MRARSNHGVRDLGLEIRALEAWIEGFDQAREHRPDDPDHWVWAANQNARQVAGPSNAPGAVHHYTPGQNETLRRAFGLPPPPGRPPPAMGFRPAPTTSWTSRTDYWIGERSSEPY